MFQQYTHALFDYYAANNSTDLRTCAKHIIGRDSDTTNENARVQNGLIGVTGNISWVERPFHAVPNGYVAHVGVDSVDLNSGTLRILTRENKPVIGRPSVMEAALLVRKRAVCKDAEMCDDE